MERGNILLEWKMENTLNRLSLFLCFICLAFGKVTVMNYSPRKLSVKLRDNGVPILVGPTQRILHTSHATNIDEINRNPGSAQMINEESRSIVPTEGIFYMSDVMEEKNKSRSVELPGDVFFLAGDAAELVWMTSINETNIVSCYWEYSDCPSDPDASNTTKNCTPQKLFGYMNNSKPREDNSIRHEGSTSAWLRIKLRENISFERDLVWVSDSTYYKTTHPDISPSHKIEVFGNTYYKTTRHDSFEKWEVVSNFSPCKGGLRTNMLEHKHAGWYRMTIYTTVDVEDEASPLIQQSTTWSELRVYYETDLQLWLLIGDMPRSHILLRHARNGIIELKAQTLKSRSVTINVWGMVPSETKVTIKRHDITLDETTVYIEQCAGPCTVDMVEDGTIVLYVIEVDTGIQGYPVVSIRQRCIFKEVYARDDDDRSSISETYPWWLLPVLVCVIVLFAIATFIVVSVLCILRRKMKRKARDWSKASYEHDEGKTCHEDEEFLTIA